MKATITAESYRLGRNLVKVFALNPFQKLPAGHDHITGLELSYNLDTGHVVVTPELENDPTEAEHFMASFFVDREDYDLLSHKADKYVIEEYFGRAVSVTIIQEVEIDFMEEF